MNLLPTENNATTGVHEKKAGGFCHDSLWDSQLSWYTTSHSPDLTECFKSTVLVWTPAVFLAACSLFHWLHNVRERQRRKYYGPKSTTYTSATDIGGGEVRREPQFLQRKNFLRSPLFATKIAFCFLFIGAAAVQLIYMISDGKSSPAVIVGGGIEILALLLAFALVYTSQLQFRRTSGILFCFFGLLFMAHLARFYSAFVNFSYGGNTSLLVLSCETLMLIASAILLILHCFADTYGRIPVDKNETPRATASFLSQLTIAWLTPLLWRTWRKSTPLQLPDLWTLEFNNRAEYVCRKFERCWHAEIERVERLDRDDASKSNSRNEIALVTQNGHADKNDAESSTSPLTTTPNDVPKSPSTKQPSLLRAMFNIIRAEVLLAFCLNLIGVVLTFISPLLLKALIQSVSDTNSKLWQGVLLALLLCATSIAFAVVDNRAGWIQWNYGLNFRSAVIAAVYRKALRMSNDTRQKYTVGELVNFVSIDAEKVFQFSLLGLVLFTAPIVIVVAVVMLWNELGWAALAGVAFMIILIPFNGWVVKIQGKFYAAQLERKDERIKLTSEVLNGVKLLKFYAWETPFISRLNAIRFKELVLLRKAALLQAAGAIAWDLSPFLVSLCSFGAFVLASPANTLTVERTFVSLSLMKILSVPLGWLPNALSMLSQFLVSTERLRKFLTSEEHPQAEQQKALSKLPAYDDAVRIVNASFAWSKTPADGKSVLADIDLRIKVNSLTAIVGHVGAGKSSLCAAVLGQLDRINSDDETTTTVYSACESVAYVPQQAWIQNASVRDNILFGQPCNAELYHQELDACALLPDLEIFPAGDATEIGEKGLNLSGGQKQRVSLARAAYSDAQLMVLDDPLSAVDAHVAKHIFEKLLSNHTGLLRNKTRILATHHVGFLPYVDQIVVLDHGRIVEHGTYRELLERNGAFAVFLRNYVEDSNSSPTAKKLEDEINAEELANGAEVLANDIAVNRNNQSVQLPPIGALSMSLAAEENVNKFNSVKSRTVPDHIPSQTAKEAKKIVIPDDDELENGRLLTREATTRLRVSQSVYATYARLASYSLTALFILSLFAYSGINAVSQIWLARWSATFTAYEQQQDNTHQYRESFLILERNFYLLVYVLLGTGQLVFLLVSVVSLALAAVRASRRLHDAMLERIMHAPMSFFDTTPTGRILSRFSKDLDAVDVNLPQNIQGWMECIVLVGGSIFVICYGSPWFIVALPVFFIMWITIQRFFVTTNVQVRRLELIGRGPLLSFFTETMQGLHVVRAMQAQQRFIREFDTLKIDRGAMPMFCNAVCIRWVSMFSNFIAALIILVSALCVLMLKGGVLGSVVGASVLGLVLSNAISITAPLQWAIRLFVQVDSDIVSVERIDEYSKVEQEARETSGSEPSLQWPEQGKIEFLKYKTRYRPGMRLVLKGISAQIKQGEKVGIVGRTGAGKSSLTMALFRLVEASDEDWDDINSNGGYIAIDGINIAKVSLDTLRSRLTILPQEPTLFSGSLRFNLDPAGAHSDAKVWEALEHAHLKQWVKSHTEGLEFMVAEEGSNMSVGQRQLVCLARALLRKTRVLVLDEATAAVDVETDELIQTTIRREFANATVVTIAHRINTILDYDRVTVLDDGKVKEFGAPSELLRDEQSEFSRLARDANIKESYHE